MSRPAAPLQFATVLRGYDREQVDEYVAALQEFLQEAQDRASAAQRAVDGSAAAQAPGDPDETTASLALTPAARAVHGLPQRLAEAVREALEAAERAGRAALSEVEHERAALTEQARTAREQARHDADELVGQAQAEAERLVRAAREEADRRLRESAEQADRQVREAAAEAEETLRRGREEDRRAQLAAEDQLTGLRQRADQEQARHDHIVRQIEVLRQWLDGPSRPDQGGLARSLFGSEPVAAERQAAQPAPPAEIDLDQVERDRAQRAAQQRRTGQGPAAAPDAADEAPTDVLDARSGVAQPAAATAEEDADPYGDRTQVLRIVE